MILANRSKVNYRPVLLTGLLQYVLYTLNFRLVTLVLVASETKQTFYNNTLVIKYIYCRSALNSWYFYKPFSCNVTIFSFNREACALFIPRINHFRMHITSLTCLHTSMAMTTETWKCTWDTRVATIVVKVEKQEYSTRQHLIFFTFYYQTSTMLLVWGCCL